jgi:hypothetical protein
MASSARGSTRITEELHSRSHLAVQRNRKPLQDHAQYTLKTKLHLGANRKVRVELHLAIIHQRYLRVLHEEYEYLLEQFLYFEDAE